MHNNLESPRFRGRVVFQILDDEDIRAVLRARLGGLADMA